MNWLTVSGIMGESTYINLHCVYCMLRRHYPQLKGTTVASTPEGERLRQLSTLNSMVINTST